MEIELKYTIEDESVAETLFLDPYIEKIKDKQTEEEIEMYAVYFDTADRRLYREGIAFRVRREGSILQATLKWNGSSEGGMHKREEINVPVDDEDKLHNPDLEIFTQSEMCEVMKSIVGERQLLPMMEVSFIRHQVRIDTGKSISELSVDKGEVKCAGKRAPILEMEIELFSGEEDDMISLGEKLAEKFNLRAENTSKFKRGLNLID